jgi:hypothetical protein
MPYLYPHNSRTVAVVHGESSPEYSNPSLITPSHFRLLFLLQPDQLHHRSRAITYPEFFGEEGVLKIEKLRMKDKGISGDGLRSVSM